MKFISLDLTIYQDIQRYIGCLKIKKSLVCVSKHFYDNYINLKYCYVITDFILTEKMIPFLIDILEYLFVIEIWNLFTIKTSTISHIPKFKKLRYLYISNRIISNITSIPSIDTLVLRHCSKVKSIPTFSNLKFLVLESVKEDFVIPELPNLEELHIEHSHLKKLPYFPKILTLEVKYTDIEEIPCYDTLEFLECVNNYKLRKLPEKLINLEELLCPMYYVIPFYEKLEKLIFHSYLDAFFVSDDLDNLISLEMSDSEENNVIEKKIPRLPNLKTLNMCSLYFNENIKDNYWINLETLIWKKVKLNMRLPKLDKLKNLEISDMNIDYIPYYPNLNRLYILNCTKFWKLPKFKNLEFLSCNETKILYIPQYKNLRYLSIKYTPIRFLPKLNKLEYLDCESTLITYLPYFPKLSFINCSDTKIKKLKVPNNINLKIESESYVKIIKY